MRKTRNQSTRHATSDAAYTAAPKGAASLCLEAIRQAPRSVDELMHDLSMSHSTCSAAVNRLLRLGWVYDAGFKTVTRTGREAIVWVARLVPVPIDDSRPTRRELERRIAAALSVIDRNHSDLTHLRRVLKGETDE